MPYQYSGDFNKPFVRKSGRVPVQFVRGHGEDFADYPNELLLDMEKNFWELNNLADDPQYVSVVKEHRQILREGEARLIPGQH